MVFYGEAGLLFRNGGIYGVGFVWNGSNGKRDCYRTKIQITDFRTKRISTGEYKPLQ